MVKFFDKLFSPAIKSCNTPIDSLINPKDIPIRERAMADYVKAKEKAIAAYDAKLAESDYKEIEDIIRTMAAALTPLVEKRNKVIEEAKAEYERVINEERAKCKDHFLYKI